MTTEDLSNTDTSKAVSCSRENDGLSELEKEEYLLKENPNRFVIFPIQEQEIWDYYKKAQGSFWKVEEIKNISQDLIDWETKLDSDEKHFIKMILAFFANTDGIVNENLAARFMTEVQSPEARCFIKGTKVSMADGTSKPIERVKVGDRVLGWNATHKCVVPAKVTFTKHHVNPQPCVKVTLEDGRTITSTYDHQFLTSDGTFVEARDLVSKKARVSVTCDFALAELPIAQDSSWSLSLGEFGTLDVVKNLDKTLAFARLVGYIITDGSCAKNKRDLPTLRCWTGTDIGKRAILDDVELLCGKRPNVGANVYSVNIPEKFGRAIYNTDPLVFAPGDRVDKPYCLPTFITAKDCPLVVIREFLGGLFGGDGTTTNLGGPPLKFVNVGFSATKTTPHVESLITGFNTIVALLDRFGVKAHIQGKKINDYGNTLVTIECVGGSNTVKFAETIGFRYDAHKMVKLAIGASYYRMRDICSEFYKDVIITAHRIRDTTGKQWDECRDIAIIEVRNRRLQIGSDKQCLPSGNAIYKKGALTSERGIMMSERHSVGLNPTSATQQWVTSIEALNLLRNVDKNNKDHCYAVKPKDIGLPIIQLKVLDVTPVGDHEVYDLTIENPINSFVAEGAVVHNCFYGFQIAIENIHGEMYSLLIDTYIRDATEKLFLLRAIHNIDSIKALSGWAVKWINSSKSFATRLVAFACVEGIFFSGPFCAIFWLKKRGLMPALTASNEFISRDEALHCEFACLLYGYLEKTRLDQSVVYQIVEEAVAFEKQFITESLPCRLIGMNAHSMCTYIEFCADRLIMMLGYPPLWNAQNPYDFMNNIGLDGKTNFFEKNTTEYSQSGFEEGASHTITLHEDF